AQAPWWVTPPPAEEAPPPGPAPGLPTDGFATGATIPLQPRRRRALAFAGFAAAALLLVGAGVGLVWLGFPNARAPVPPRAQGGPPRERQESALLPAETSVAAPEALTRPQAEVEPTAPAAPVKRRLAEIAGPPDLPRKARPLNPAPAIAAN